MGFWDKVQPRDLIAVLLLLGLLWCKYHGLNGMIDTSIALIIGYYFSKRVYEEQRRNRVNSLAADTSKLTTRKGRSKLEKTRK